MSDRYCWLCAETVSVLEYTCESEGCGRSFHFGCKGTKQVPLWQKKCPFLRELIASKSSCWVCHHAIIFDANYSPDDYYPMNRAILRAVKRLESMPESIEFRLIPPDALDSYRKFIATPMDLRTMHLKAANGTYKSPEEFYYDLLLIVLNSKVLSRSHRSTLFYAQARQLFAFGREDYCKLSYCYECYRHRDRAPDWDNSARFLESCRLPHSVVWAPHPDHSGLYLPAKIVNFRDLSASRDIDVVFFGCRTLAQHLPLNACYAYSQLAPSAAKRTDQTNGQPTATENLMARANEEVRRYLSALLRATIAKSNGETNGDTNGTNGDTKDDYSMESLASLLGAKGLTVWRDPSTKLDETMLYMREFVYKFCPVNTPRL